MYIADAVVAGKGTVVLLSAGSFWIARQKQTQKRRDRRMFSWFIRSPCITSNSSSHQR